MKYFFIIACVHLGKVHKPGTTFPQGDSCNSCTCMSTGNIKCTENKCFPGITLSLSCTYRNTLLIRAKIVYLFKM